MIREMKLKAMAKINLGLDVIGVRPDGYHDLRMIMQSVSLYDKLEITLLSSPGIRVHTNLGFLPDGEENLVYRAASLLIDEFAPEQGVYIDLQKHIPVAAGLGGGSSDAAAVLTGLNRMLELNLTDAQLMQRGVKIGADVPFCILRGTALAEGIGEKLTVLPGPPQCTVLLAKPPVHVSTKYVYSNLKMDQIPSHPDIDGQVRALREADLPGLASRMENVLESVTVPAYPVIRSICDLMRQQGALGAMMSGSGPTVFGLFEGEGQAEKAAEMIRSQDMGRVFLTRFFGK